MFLDGAVLAAMAKCEEGNLRRARSIVAAANHVIAEWHASATRLWQFGRTKPTTKMQQFQCVARSLG